MSNIEKIIPFIIKWEASTVGTGLSNSQLFDKARTKGWSNNPNDAGGATMIGVTLATYQSYCKGKGLPQPSADDLKKIQYQTWLVILKSLYWDKWKADTIDNQSIANMLVDWAWLSGKNGIVIPQRLLGVTQDGIVGPKTIEAINKLDSKTFFDQLYKARLKYIDDIIANRPANKVFKTGWLNRLNDLKYEK